MLLCSVPVSAYDFEVDGIYYNITSETDLTVEVTYRNTNSYKGMVVIPEGVTYNGKTYSVTSIGGSAFYNCSGLTNITIPNSVTSIGESAFYGCSGLTSVTIGNSVTSIGGSAFYGCSGLTSIIVDENNTTYDSRDNCNAIIETGSNELVVGCKSTVIPNSVTSIGGSAFYGCSGLTSITIPNSVTSIEGSAFSGCSGLTSITIPNSVTSIGGPAFSGCSGIKELIIEDGGTPINLSSINCPLEYVYIGRDCSSQNKLFAEGNTLKTAVIGPKVTCIGNNLFSGCSGLTSVTIGDSVTSIGNYAFKGCSGLTSIAIPNSVTSIGDWAFYGCSGLTSVIIGDSVTSIEYGAFNGCSALEVLTVGAKIPPTASTLGFGLRSQQYETVKLQVPEGSKAMYQSAKEWKKFFNIEEFDPTGIADIIPDAEDKNLPIYNLQGARMTGDRENLPTGIYIQGGKKFVVK